MDNYRPSYHFRPQENWMNDPNGPLYYRGEYHLFFQYNPNGDRWGTIHWGHARSRDLIHWELCRTALAPDPQLQEVHCYSGCAFVRDGLPVIYYTSVGEKERGPMEGALQCAAVSRDGMNTWQRMPAPVLDKSLHESKGIHIAMWRDPFVWEEEDGFYALLGGTLTDQAANCMEEVEQGRGCLALYHAPRGRDWEFKNIIVSSAEYYLLECPNMLRFGSQYLLLYSPLDAVRYQIGTLDKTTWTFHAQQEGIFDYSIGKTGFYAPNTYLNDPRGRKIVIGWLSEADRQEIVSIRGWAGLQSIPREVWLENGQLHTGPVEEALLLRKNVLYTGTTELWEQSRLPQYLTSGRALEIELTLSCLLDSGGGLELAVLADPFAREETVICYEQDSGRVRIDRSRSSLFRNSVKAPVDAYLEGHCRKELQLRIYLDHSAVEVFVGEAFTMAARVYPVLHDSCGVWLRGAGQIRIKELTVWKLDLQ